jgi:hypothetical protein
LELETLVLEFHSAQVTPADAELILALFDERKSSREPVALLRCSPEAAHALILAIRGALQKRNEPPGAPA